MEKHQINRKAKVVRKRYYQYKFEDGQEQGLLEVSFVLLVLKLKELKVVYQCALIEAKGRRAHMEDFTSVWFPTGQLDIGELGEYFFCFTTC